MSSLQSYGTAMSCKIKAAMLALGLRPEKSWSHMSSYVQKTGFDRHSGPSSLFILVLTAWSAYGKQLCLKKGFGQSVRRGYTWSGYPLLSARQPSITKCLLPPRPSPRFCHSHQVKRYVGHGLVTAGISCILHVGRCKSSKRAKAWNLCLSRLFCRSSEWAIKLEICARCEKKGLLQCRLGTWMINLSHACDNLDCLQNHRISECSMTWKTVSACAISAIEQYSIELYRINLINCKRSQRLS